MAQCIAARAALRVLLTSPGSSRASASWSRVASLPTLPASWNEAVPHSSAYPALLSRESAMCRQQRRGGGSGSGSSSDPFARLARMMGGIASVAATAAAIDANDGSGGSKSTSRAASAAGPRPVVYMAVDAEVAAALAAASAHGGAYLSSAAAVSAAMSAAAHTAAAELGSVSERGLAPPRLGGAAAGAPSAYSGVSSGAVAPPPSASARAGHAAIAGLGRALYDHRELGYVLTLGSVAGFCSGYATKKVGRVAAVVIGVAFIAAQIARHYDVGPQVDWSRVEHTINETLDTDGDGRLTHVDVKNYFDRAMTALAPTAASSTAFVAAFIIGLRYG